MRQSRSSSPVTRPQSGISVGTTSCVPLAARSLALPLRRCRDAQSSAGCAPPGAPPGTDCGRALPRASSGPMARIDDGLAWKMSIRPGSRSGALPSHSRAGRCDRPSREEHVARKEAALGVVGEMRGRVTRYREHVERHLRRAPASRRPPAAPRASGTEPRRARHECRRLREQVRSPAGMCTGAPVLSARSATPTRWSQCPCVSRIAMQRAPGRPAEVGSPPLHRSGRPPPLRSRHARHERGSRSSRRDKRKLSTTGVIGIRV